MTDDQESNSADFPIGKDRKGAAPACCRADAIAGLTGRQRWPEHVKVSIVTQMGEV